jgi:hypothetical protein
MVGEGDTEQRTAAPTSTNPRLLSVEKRQNGKVDCRRGLRRTSDEALGRDPLISQEGRVIPARITDGDLADEFQAAMDAHLVVDPLLGGHDDHAA